VNWPARQRDEQVLIARHNAGNERLAELLAETDSRGRDVRARQGTSCAASVWSPTD
jgi:hypothetical protein